MTRKWADKLTLITLATRLAKVASPGSSTQLPSNNLFCQCRNFAKFFYVIKSAKSQCSGLDFVRMVRGTSSMSIAHFFNVILIQCGFKIKLTLFKVTFLPSGKIYWIHLKVFTKCDILWGCGESSITIAVQLLKWESLSDKLSKNIFHTCKVYGVLLAVESNSTICSVIVDNNTHSAVKNCAW